MSALTGEQQRVTELHELRLRLAAAERAEEQARRDYEVNYWKTNTELKLRRARAKVAELGNRLAEIRSQGALRL